MKTTRQIPRLCSWKLLLIAILALLSTECARKTRQVSETQPQPSAIGVSVSASGPIVLTTSAAEFQVLPSGYIQASLLQDGKKLSLDEPQEGNPAESDYLVDAGGAVHFTPDLSHAKVDEATGKLGRGKRVTIPAQAAGLPGKILQRTLQIEVYDDFPTLLLSSATYTNTGTSDYQIDKIVEQQHRFNSHAMKEAPYDMWSYQGASYDWGEDDIVKLTKTFSRPNVLGAVVKDGYGGGIPVAAFWNASVGEAIGHVETLPLSLSLPVKVETDGRVDASVTIPMNATLKPGETYSTPRSFLAIYSGDFYQPLRLWSSVLQKEGWELPKPSSEAYNVSWCGWGYEFNVTPAQMLGTVPKLKSSASSGLLWTIAGSIRTATGIHERIHSRAIQSRR